MREGLAELSDVRRKNWARQRCGSTAECGAEHTHLVTELQSLEAEVVLRLRISSRHMASVPDSDSRVV